MKVAILFEGQLMIILSFPLKIMNTLFENIVSIGNLINEHLSCLQDFLLSNYTLDTYYSPHLKTFKCPQELAPAFLHAIWPHQSACPDF